MTIRRAQVAGGGSQDSGKQRDEMRERITELLQTLEKVKRSSEVQQQQQEEAIMDLKRTNE